MNIKELLPAIKEKIKSGNISLVDITATLPQLSILSTPYPEAVGLSLSKTQVKYTATDDKLSLSGEGSWEETVVAEYGFSVQNTDQGVVAKASIKLPLDYPLSIPNLTWFQIKEVEIALENTYPDEEEEEEQENGKEALKHTMSCNLMLSEKKIPLEATIATDGKATFSIDGEAISFDGLNDMAQLVGGSEKLLFPSQIDDLGAVTLGEFKLEMDLSEKMPKTIDSIEFGFSTSHSWELMPDLFMLEDMTLKAKVHNPIDKSINFSGSIEGIVKLAETKVILSAKKEKEKDPWIFTAEIPKLSFSDLAENVLGEFSLDITLPKINFVDTKLMITPSLNSFSFESASSPATSWKIPLGVTTLDVKGMKLSLEKSEEKYEGHIEGSADLFGATVTVSADLNDNLKLSATATDVNLTDIADAILQDISLPSEIPNVEFDEVSISVTPATKEFSINASSTEDIEIPIGAAGLEIEDLQFTFERKKEKNNKYTTSSSFKGEASLGPVSFILDYSLPGDLVFTTHIPSLNLSPVIQDLCGPDTVMSLPVPADIMDLSLNDITLIVSPTKKFISISSSCILGKSEMIVSQNEQKKWVFMAAFAPPEHWKFSALDPSLGVLDELDFSGTALIISSADEKKPPISIVEIPESVSVIKGLTFFASLNMEGLGLDDLMDIKSLTVSTNIGTSLASMKLSAAIDGSFKIAENIAMGDMKFFLRPSPTNFQLGISGAVLAKIDDDDLKFIGTMSIRPIERSAAFGATMIGTWNEPFGIKGLSMGDIAIEVGIGIIPPPAVVAPIVGIAGTIGIGEFDGSAAVKFDTAMPSKSMIAASFNELYLNDVIQSFCDEEVYNSIPLEIRETVLSSGMEDVAVYVVPQATTIGELLFDPGFKFQGKMSIADFDAEFAFILDYSSGFAIKATIDPIIIKDVFEITGIANSAGPLLDVDLRIGNDPHIMIEGKVDLLGIGGMVYVTLMDSGFHFQVEGNIFNLFEAKVIASGTDLKSSGDIYLLAEMKNDLITFLREGALDGIQAAANETTKAIQDAQGDIDTAQAEIDKIDVDIAKMRNTIKQERERDAENVKEAENIVDKVQAEVDKLKGLIDDMRRKVKAERARDAKKVKDAENVVNKEKNKVAGIQKQIDSMRATIKKERARDVKKISDAKSAISSAQRKVNGIQGEINKQKRKISSLKSAIAKKKKWYKKSKWYQKSYRWAQYAAYASAKGIEITACYTAIGALETAKATAIAALEVAKQTLKAIEKAANIFPIDADPRILALFTAKGTAELALDAATLVLKGLQELIKKYPVDADARIIALFGLKETADLSLEAARQTLKGLQEVIKNFPIDADVRIIALFTIKEGADAVLVFADSFLEGVKQTAGGMAEVGSFIVEQGLGGLLDIKRARFEGDLNIVQGGSVSMAIDLELMSKDMQFDLAFNFHEPLKAIEKLVEELVDEIT